MAFTRFPDPTNNISNLANQPVEPPATLKQKFDQVGEDLKDWANNTFLPELEATTNGDSGADNIGATPVGAGVSTTVQGIMEELDAKIDTQLPTPDGSITDVKLSNTAGQIKDVVWNHTEQLNLISVVVESTGDGVFDDTANVQYYADLAKGKILHFPAKPQNPSTVYLLSDAIWISEKTIVTSDFGVTLKRKNSTITNSATVGGNNIFILGSTKGVEYTALSPAEWVMFDRISIDGNCQNQSGYTVLDFNKGGWGLYLKFVKNAIVRDCKIEKCVAGGLISSMTPNLVLDNVECSYNAIQSNFLNTGNGFDLQGLSDSSNPELRSHLFVSNCKSHHNADNGFMQSSATDISFTNCHSWNNGNSSHSTNSAIGFELTGAISLPYPKSIQFNNCSSKDNVRSGFLNNSGFRIFSSGDVEAIQINNMLVSGQTGYGVDCSFQYGSLAKLQISNLNIDWNGGVGNTGFGFLSQFVNSVQAEDIQLSNIKVKCSGIGNAGFGIVGGAGSQIESVMLSNVKVRGSSSIGISCNGNIKNLTMNSCHSFYNTTDGIVIYGNGQTVGSVVINGCISNDNTRDGIAFLPNSGVVEKVTINGCIMRRNRWGLTNTAMTGKVLIDQTTIIEDNASGALNAFGTKINFQSAFPTSGTWKVGDIVYNTAPAASGYIGWVCTVAGTSGTWKGFGVIQA